VQKNIVEYLLVQTALGWTAEYDTGFLLRRAESLSGISHHVDKIRKATRLRKVNCEVAGIKFLYWNPPARLHVFTSLKTTIRESIEIILVHI
jgi:hypothetical protein